MYSRQSLLFGRNKRQKVSPYADEEAEKPTPDPKEEEKKDEQVSQHPLHIGKAMPDEEEEAQGPASTIGIVPKISFRWIFSGPSSSGKSNAARWLLDKFYSKVFDRVILLSPTAEIDPVWQKLKILKKKDRITKMSMSPIKRLLREQEAEVKRVGKKKAKKVLVIYDDTIGDKSVINDPKFLVSFIRGRHFCVSCFVMTQSYTKIPRAVRLQATALSVFPSFRSEIERLYEEHGPYQLSKKEWFELVQSAMQKTDDEPFPFFFIDSTKPVEDRYRRCLYTCLTIDPGRRPGNEGERKRKRKNASADDAQGEGKFQNPAEAAQAKYDRPE
jgi:hypothetical protein